MPGQIQSLLTLALLLFSLITAAAEDSERAITLHVIDAETGKPVIGAEVRRGMPDIFGIRPEPAPEATTDAHGNARWTLYPATEAHTGSGPPVSLMFSHPGYPSISAMRISKGRLKLEEFPAEITFNLRRGIRIGGVVNDADGRPIANARVYVQSGDSPVAPPRFEYGKFLERPYVKMVSRDARSQVVRTDKAGRWSITNAPPEADLYVLKVIREDGSDGIFGTEFAHYRPLFKTSAAPLPEVFMEFFPVAAISLADLRAGNVVTSLDRGYTVRGRVVDGQGKPIAGARVREAYIMRGPDSGAELQTDSGGRFEYRNRRPGEVSYTVDAPGYALRTGFEAVSPETPEILIALEPARPARVEVLWDNHRPALGAWVMSNPNDPMGFQGLWRQLVDTNGIVIWSNAPAPRALVWVVGTNGAPVEVYIKPGELTHVILTNSPP